VTWSTTHPLDRLPVGAVAHGVTASPDVIDGRGAMRVELTDQITRDGAPRVDYIDMPTFLRIPADLRTGVISVDVRSRLNGKTSFDARGFAGIAYRIRPGLSAFECVYLRPLNGVRLEPQPPRNRRAVQYFAYPDAPFDHLREQYPDGRYEAGADIAPDEWIALRVAVHEETVDVFVDGEARMHVDRPLGPALAGDVGLFVDIGTEAWFADLQIEKDS
jgi:hypothetical protein